MSVVFTTTHVFAVVIIVFFGKKTVLFVIIVRGLSQACWDRQDEISP